MNRTKTSYLKNCILLAMLVSLMFVNAQGKVPKSNTLTSLVNSDFVIDNVKSHIAAPINSDIYTYQPEGYINLYIDNDSGPFVHYKYDIELEIKKVLSNASIDSNSAHTLTLSVEFNPLTNTGNLTDQVYHKISNSYGVSIKIISFTTTYMANGTPVIETPDNIKMDIGFNAIQFTDIASQSAPSGLSISTNSVTNENIINWQPIVGALSYDLEWAWADTYGQTSGDIPVADLKNNSTRINTKQTSYTIPNIYGEGKLNYRVRAVSRFPDNYEVNYYGPWSTIERTVTLAHEEEKNWQFQASYAEDGKKKEVVSYFDGTLRNRQTVTKINSDDNAIVGEVIYDNQGRPAIEVLPVPTESNRLGFYNDFNLNINDVIYTHKDFDWEASQIACEVNINGMSPNMGASRYYSSQYNSNSAFHDYVPDANNHPFSQIEYMPDNTGRIKRKSGVGLTHQLGSDHEMKYIYSTPFQPELDRLFASEVGWSYHYKKNAVIDPNGQVSVSYIDPQGRTIATALVADNPPNLEGLDGEIDLNDVTDGNGIIDGNDPRYDNNNSPFPKLEHDVTTQNLLYTLGDGNYGANQLYNTQELEGINVDNALRFSAFKSVLTNSQAHNFSYSLTVNEAFSNECIEDVSPGNGYPFVYDLELNATDDCGVPISPNVPVSQYIGQFDLSTYTGNPINLISTSSNYQITPITFGGNPPIGDMGIHKLLKVNKEALDIFADDYIAKAQEIGCILDASAFGPDADNSGCYLSCNDCVRTFLANNDETLLNGLNSLSEIDLSQIDFDVQKETYVLNQLQPYIVLDDTLNDTNNETRLALEERFEREFDLIIQECMLPCQQDGISNTDAIGNDFTNSLSCSVIYDLLIDDVQPTGQYGKNETIFSEGGGLSDTVHPVDASVSLFNADPENNPNQLFTDYAASIRGHSSAPTSYSWKDPFNPAIDVAGSISIGHYYESDGVTVSKIEFNRQDDGTWLPEYGTVDLDEDGEFGIDVDGDGNIDDLDVLDTDEDGFIEIEPQFLIDVDDFITEWKPSWANSLVIYHPEYAYAKYAELMCSMNSSFSFNGQGDGTENIQGTANIDGFENLLNGMTYSDALAAGFLNPNVLSAIIASDPLFSEPLPTNLGLPTSPNYDSVIENIMNQALTDDYEGTGMELLARALAVVTCNSIQTCTITLGTGGITNLDIELTTNEDKEFLWQSYRGYYLSLRKRIYDALAHTYASLYYAYNGCIGEDGNDDPRLGLNNNYTISGFATSSNVNTICGNSPELYSNKAKRYLSSDVLYNSSDNIEDIYDDITEQVDIINFTETGACPLVQDLQIFLNGMATEVVGVDANGNDTYIPFVRDNVPFTGNYVTKDLFAELSGTDPAGAVPNNNTIEIDSNNINNGVNGINTELTIDISLSGYTFTPITINLSSNFVVDQGKDWTDYVTSNSGTGFTITNITNLQYAESYTENPTEFNFACIANVQLVTGGVISNDIIQVVLSGKTQARIGECYISGQTNVAVGNNGPIGMELPGGSLADCDERHVGFGFALTGYHESPISHTRRQNVARALIPFLNQISEDDLIFSSYDMASAGKSRTRAFQYDIPVNDFVLNLGDEIDQYPGGWSPQPRAYSPNDSNQLFQIYHGYSGYKYAFQTIMKDMTIPNTSNSESSIITKPLDVMYFFLMNNYYNDIIEDTNAYQNFISNPLINKVVFIIVKNEFSIHGQSGAIDLEPSTYLKSIMGRTPIEYDPNNPNTAYDYIGFTATELDTFNLTELTNFLNTSYNQTFNSNGIGLDCNDCIPQTLPVVSNTEKYEDFMTSSLIVATEVSKLDENGSIVLDEYGNSVIDYYETDIEGYTLPAYYTEQYFINLQYGLIVDGYLNYLTQLNIESIEDSNFIELPDFGATALNYGYDDYTTVITAFNTHLNDVNIEVKKSWSEFVSDYLVDNSNICPPRMVTQNINTSIPDEKSDCEEFYISVSEAYSQDNYDAYIERLKTQFKIDYTQAALENVAENFTLSYADKEYQYTLYYYDQAGNLTRTVPPQGVDRIEFSSIDSDPNDDIVTSIYDQDRLDNQTTEQLPGHQLDTKYQYNSLNQLVKQHTPDGGETRFAYDKLGRIIASQNAKQATESNLVEIVETITETPTFINQSSNITINGNTINCAYTGNLGWLSGTSTQEVITNDGYVEWEILGTRAENDYIITGLTYQDNDKSNTDVYYRFYTNKATTVGSTYDVSINDQNPSKTVEQPWEIGDKLKIERVGTLINFYINNVVVRSHTETVSPGQPLRFDCSIRTSGTISNVKIVNVERIYNEVETYEEEITPLTFINPSTDITINGNNVSCTYTYSGWSSGVTSQQAIINDGYVEWEALGDRSDYEYVVAGLTYQDNNYTSDDVYYRFYTNGLALGSDYWAGITGQNPVDTVEQEWEIGDKLKIERIGNQINFYINNVLVRSHAETVALGQPLYFDCSFRNNGTISNIKIVNIYNQIERFSYTNYDDLGRIQEAGEFKVPLNRYKINDLGRLIYDDNTEVEVTISDAFPNDLSYKKNEVTKTFYDDHIEIENGSNLYNNATAVLSSELFTSNYTPFNSINRVTSVLYYEALLNDNAIDLNNNAINNGLFYNYDVHGNVKEMVTYIPDLKILDFNNYNSAEVLDWEPHIKRVHYNYDLISGNVNEVIFQPKKVDQFIHRYEYDDDNRIVNVKTSENGVIWEEDANYKYYEHGPLARTELGDKKVQGLDYIYTLQGWLKAVNGESIAQSNNDIGSDGLGININVAKDAFGFALNYFDNDYTPVGNINTTPFKLTANNIGTSINNLYNGNIKSMITTLRDFNESHLATQVNNYSYDQLNRIKSMSSLAVVDNSTDPLSSQNSYSSSYSYDRNGNLQSLTRDAFDINGVMKPMDNLSYHYKADTNQLLAVNEDSGISDNDFDNDLDGHDFSPQSSGIGGNPFDSNPNYVYDEIGQLIEDKEEKLKISWRVDGKVKEIVKTTQSGDEEIIEFRYDGLGNRLAKVTKNNATYYSRDAQGNVLGVYDYNEVLTGNNSYLKTLTLKENHIYGSSRLGIANTSETVSVETIDLSNLGGNTTINTDFDQDGITNNIEIGLDTDNDGIPNFLDDDDDNDGYLTVNESSTADNDNDGIVDYLDDDFNGSIEGNNPLLVTNTYFNKIGDKRYELSNHLGNVLSVITDRKLRDANETFFMPDVVAYNDYYPFGSLLPNRHGATDSYRYGFQGQEKDDEIKGEGNSINYKYRMHDPRVGRFFAIDPLFKKYPHYTPYSFSGNKVIAFAELEGLEESYVIRGEKIVKVVTQSIMEQPNGFDTYAQAESAQKMGFTSSGEVKDYIAEQENIIMTSAMLELFGSEDTKNETVIATPTVQEKYPQHFPGYEMGPQLFEGGKELVADMVLVGLINKISQLRKLVVAGDKIKDATVAGNKVKNGVRTGKGLSKLKKAINPSGSGTNCVLCSIAFEKKIAQGINMVAKATGPDAKFISTLKKYFPNAKRITSFGSTKGLYSKLDDIKGSNKSSIIVGYFRKSSSTSDVGAHAFNAVKNKNGTWKFIDAQNGLELTKESLQKTYGRFDIIITN